MHSREYRLACISRIFSLLAHSKAVVGGSRAVSSLSGSPRASVSSADALRALRSPVSRGISKNQYTRARRREKGLRSKGKKKKYSIFHSPWLFSLFPPMHLSVFLSFFFSRYSPAKRIARSRPVSLFFSRNPTSRTIGRENERNIERYYIKKETDRFQGRGLGGSLGKESPVEARESLFSQKRAAFGISLSASSSPVASE